MKMVKNFPQRGWLHIPSHTVRPSRKLHGQQSLDCRRQRFGIRLTREEINVFAIRLNERCNNSSGGLTWPVHPS